MATPHTLQLPPVHAARAEEKRLEQELLNKLKDVVGEFVYESAWKVYHDNETTHLDNPFELYDAITSIIFLDPRSVSLPYKQSLDSLYREYYNDLSSK